jgi:hypothetical protein
VFQEAFAAPNDALAAQGARADVTRSGRGNARETLMTCPASSAALGEDVWRSHLEWGAAKAAAVTRPTLAVLAANLLDRDRIERVAVARGYRVQPIQGPDRVRGHALVFVDLTDAAADARPPPPVRASADRSGRTSMSSL